MGGRTDQRLVWWTRGYRNPVRKVPNSSSTCVSGETAPAQYRRSATPSPAVSHPMSQEFIGPVRVLTPVALLELLMLPTASRFLRPRREQHCHSLLLVACLVMAGQALPARRRLLPSTSKPVGPFLT